MPLVDLRSDTVTRPTPAMLRAMAAAETGDDVYGEDPTVNALEEQVAARFGHEAAVFVPTGTMGNQICLQLVVPPAEELLCGAEDHVVTYEHGGAARYGGISSRTVTAPRGLVDVDAVAPQLRPAGWGTVATRAVSVEQTHNRGGGAVHPLAALTELRALADRHGVLLHCDGARIWNAAVASGTPLEAYGALFDTLSVCMSKGLGAPVGSLVVTDAARAAEARVLRKRLGGGMRQAGVLAAAAAHALEHHLDRLADDHARARALAEALADAAPGVVDPALVETNIVPLDLTGCAVDGPQLAAAARAEGVLLSVVGPRRARLVTHLDVGDEAVGRAADVVARLLMS
ncbi:MAG TPA: GntG family PLP-dependent aldolase [Mycobacteriales bacterium]|nr:GntG family PLP-dependent aldolase [Mycobacteriales bacterium]